MHTLAAAGARHVVEKARPVAASLFVEADTPPTAGERAVLLSIVADLTRVEGVPAAAVSPLDAPFGHPLRRYWR